MNRNYRKPFAQFVKKQSVPFQARIKTEVEIICDNPTLGQLKVGDLAGIRVYKFKHKRQEYLIAYITKANNDIEFFCIDFFKIGTHENFYSELKKYLSID